ncbi:hypothetical protein SLEP1_g31635 [Rubroshorea leprosula]|uniref:RNase H type-1 domain-containing protein n=1 Tax=Rubroshorea leprosula TaxID=152421 RepID=A0AAV5K3X3_9ROSI|nr:hypothetical protein SLEP1_g31635 [Rubroshorea leprosula]
MSVREKLSIFENLQSPILLSSSQESDLRDQSTTKIPNSDPVTDTSMVYSPSPPTMQGDISMSEATQPGNLAALSYKDKLLFDENPTIVSFATTPGYMDEDSDVDDDPNDPTPIILLSKAEKRRIREPWMNALIIKAFHSKPLGYNYVFPRVKAQWKPTFNSTTTTALWARFPNLSADHYDPTTLQKIGNEVGTLLRVDAHTAHHTRGQYARVCVQIDLSRPVVKAVRIGLKDKIPPTINAISNAPAVSSDPKLVDASNAQEPETIIEDTNTKNLVAQGDTQQDCTDFGPWLLVERRKPRKKTPVVGNSSEKTMATTVPSSSRGSGAPIRKLGPKSQSGSTTNRTLLLNPLHLVPHLHPPSLNPLTAHRYFLLSVLPQPMEPLNFLSLHPNLQICLVRGNTKIRLDYALERMLAGVSPRSENWTMPQILEAWLAPIITCNHMDLQGILHLIPAPSTDLASREQFQIMNLESSEGANIEEDLGLIIPHQISSSAYMPHLKIINMKGKMEHLQLVSKMLPSLFTKTEMDYETLLIPFHFSQARFLFKDQRLPVPILDSTLAQILLGISNQSDWMVKIISWNYRGAAKHNCHSSAMDLKRTHNPAIMLVVETKLSGEDARSQVASLGFAKSFVVNSNGLAGGLWLLWDDAAVVVDIVSYSDQAIHAIIKVCNNPSFPIDWFLSGIYGRPQIATRALLWNELSTIAENISMPWMMIGDFNDVLDQSEKFGGNRICQARFRAYLECMNNCNMIDLGFVGNRFTWINMRFSHQLIRERLDRAWENPEWKLLFPEATLFHLPRTSSDHCPILLDLKPFTPRTGSRPFRMEKFWLDHPEFQALIQQICRSGQRVNPAKSKIFFSKNVSINNRESLSTILGFPCTEDLGTYLGRVTLTSSVLAAIPNYYMQTMLLPASVHTELDQISRNFIWGLEDNQKKIHLVGWQTVTQPKDLGGLGLKSSKEANVAAMSKLNWRLYMEKDKLWCNIFRSKYNLSDCHSPLPASGSPIWKAIIKGYDIFKAGIKWIPRSGGNVRFWTDCWCCDIPLISWIYGPHTPGFELITVAEFFNVGASAADLIAYPIPIDIEPLIHAVPISLFALREDTFAWVGSSNGSFSSASAYCITKHLPLKPLEDWRWVWKSYTYPKIQYFLWLLAHDRLKCFSYLHRLGIISSPLCPLCHLEDETVEHLIRSCPISVVILSDVLPGQSLPTPPSRGSSFFKWSKPLSPFIKLNTDGSVLGNPGGAASGGLFRDHNGSWILGFARKIGITSSLAAELWALRDGLALAVTHSYSHLIVETDSSTAFNFMMNTACVSHPLSSLILDCRDLLRLISYVQIFHIKRQSNMAADQIARMGHSLQQDFVVLPHCPVNVKLLCILDIMGYEFPRNN